MLRWTAVNIVSDAAELNHISVSSCQNGEMIHIPSFVMFFIFLISFSGFQLRCYNSPALLVP